MARRITTKEFIERSISVHGELYDYKFSEYVSGQQKVKIICSVHGPFEQSPNNHWKGKGCVYCAREKNSALKLQKAAEEFETKSKTIHKEKYDYSLVSYRGNSKKVQIVCSVHGIFEQTPGNHLSGYGCKKCAVYEHSKIQREKAASEFRNRALEVHGPRYDYSKVSYCKSDQKVKITCLVHGPFEQSPNKHLSGRGCPDCANERRGSALRKSNSEFLDLAKAIHGNKFNYDLVDYRGAAKKVKIICPVHGEFEQLPHGHLSSCGCTQCGRDAGDRTRAKTTEQFIESAVTVHGDRYDYSLVEYKSKNYKVTIICPEHGPFEQYPSSHLKGHECAECYVRLDRRLRCSERQNELNGVYVLYLRDLRTSDHLIKVGISNNLNYRCYYIARGSGNAYEVKPLAYHQMPLIDAWNLEQQTHKKLKSYQRFPRYSFGGGTECFNTSVLKELINLGLVEEDQVRRLADGDELLPVRT